MSIPMKGLITGTALAFLTATSAVDARQLTFASGTPENSLGAKAVDAFEEAVESHSNGDVKIKSYMQSLLSFMETPPGIRDGIADLGTVLTPYFPSDFPTTIMLTELTMLLEAQGVSAREVTFAYPGAISEYVFNNCPECLQEHQDRNQVFLGLASTTPYGLFCNQPIRSEADLEGKRIRIGGAQWSRWVMEMGGSPVSIPVNETYEGLSQGVVDCTAHNLPDLLNFKFIEVVSDVTMGVPGGTFGGLGTNINADTWKSLSEAERTSVAYGAAAIAAEMAVLYMADHEEALRQIDARDDVTLHEPEAALKARTKAFIEKDLEAVAGRYAEKYDVQNASVKVAEFTELLNKWVVKVQDVEDRDALRELYWKEVFSKIDVSSYGI